MTRPNRKKLPAGADGYTFWQQVVAIVLVIPMIIVGWVSR